MSCSVRMVSICARTHLVHEHLQRAGSDLQPGRDRALTKRLATSYDGNAWADLGRTSMMWYCETQ